MKEIYKNGSHGFMQIVILAIIAIAALGYFNVDLRTIFAQPIFQKIWSIFLVAWITYIKPIAMYIWASLNGLLS